MGVDYTPPLSFEQDVAEPSTAQETDSDSTDTIPPSQCSPLAPTAVSHVETPSSTSLSKPTLTPSTSLFPQVVNNNDHLHSDGSDSHYPMLQHHLNGPSRTIQHTPAIMSCIAQDFVDGVKQLNMSRELHCTEQYPLSFTGEEAVIVMQQVLSSNLQPILYHKVARALLHISPPLIAPVSYSGKPMHKVALYDSPFAVYTIVEETMNRGYTQGVYTEISPCYTYGCNQETRGCYAPTCPNRSAPNSVSLLNEHLSNEQILSQFQQHVVGSCWSATFGNGVLKSIRQEEQSRQEAIYELIYTERRYIHNLKVLDKIFVKPLRSNKVIDEKLRDQFCDNVFGNYLEILKIHEDLYQDLRECQWKAFHKGGLVDKVGYVILRHLPRITDAYAQYSSNSAFSTSTFRHQVTSNRLFRRFIRENERKEECKRLPFTHFISSPITRTQNLITLINAIHRYTSDDHPDHDDLAQCIQLLRDIAALANRLHTSYDTNLLVYEVNNNLTFTPDVPKNDTRQTASFNAEFVWRRMNSQATGNEDMAQTLCKKVTFARTVQELCKKRMVDRHSFF
ncbi:Dbl homology domain-containing protein [Lichtheimia hyalospora FSU 10163]|nr:Dbl homology domain-containing protein [Lichtheimia hyalospora FSU 10163]